MLSKNKRPYDPNELPPDKRLKSNLTDLWASNTISSSRTQEIFNDVADAGVQHFHHLKRPLDTNCARNLRRGLLKRNMWPGSYIAPVRVRSRSNHLEEETKMVSFLLPHEVVETVVRLGNLSTWLQDGGMDPLSRAHLERCKADAGVAAMVPLGLWSDGVPVSYDRTESVEVFSLNFPGLAGDLHALRVPITCVHRREIGPHTWEDLLEVISWSLKALAAGLWPTQRHDGTPCRHEDRHRFASRSLPRGALVEIRGDWKMYGETFHLPKWNSSSGICWMCKCTPQQAVSEVMNRPAMIWGSLASL